MGAFCAGNCLWQDGNAAPEAKLLSSLSKLEKLYLHYSTGPEGDIVGLSLKLPRLKVQSKARSLNSTSESFASACILSQCLAAAIEQHMLVVECSSLPLALSVENLDCF